MMIVSGAVEHFVFLGPTAADPLRTWSRARIADRVRQDSAARHVLMRTITMARTPRQKNDAFALGSLAGKRVGWQAAVNSSK